MHYFNNNNKIITKSNDTKGKQNAGRRTHAQRATETWVIAHNNNKKSKKQFDACIFYFVPESDGNKLIFTLYLRAICFAYTIIASTKSQSPDSIHTTIKTTQDDFCKGCRRHSPGTTVITQLDDHLKLRQPPSCPTRYSVQLISVIIQN